MSKKLIVLLIVAGFIGGIAGSVVNSRFANANIFDDIVGFFKKEISTPFFSADENSSTSTNGKTEPIPLYKPVIDYENAVISAVDSAAPSVVSIVVTKDLPVIEQCPVDPFSGMPGNFRDFFESGFGFEFSQPCQKGTEKQEVGGGTGFVISEDGLILTNKHVVADTKAEYTVLTNEGKKYDAKVLARDPTQDIAVLKINAPNLKPVKLGDSDAVKLGQTAIAIGNALGEYRNTVSVGVISGLGRTVTASGQGIGTETISGVFQTDAAINPGNSGGPLLNLKGEVIGVNTAMAEGAQSIGFTIPINHAKRAITSVQKTGSIKVPYLGVRYRLVDEELAKTQKLSVDYGALVRGSDEGPATIKNSPADKAGIQAEDIILEANGEKITTENPLATIIQKYNIGDTLILKIQRGDKILALSVVLAERPEL